MKKILLIVLMILRYFVNAQNLVPNPSFEVYDTCPNSTGQISYCHDWSQFVGTPDYFNTCVSEKNYVSVPYNFWGYQYPATGNAYAGVQTYFTPECREAIGAKLLFPLQIGIRYYVSFKVSMGYSPIPGTAGDNCATNNIGALFSTKPYHINPLGLYGPPPMHNYAQVFSNKLITDTTKWTEISGSFIADSIYQYIGIGNFFDDAHTDTLQITYEGGECRAFYYIDNVCVSADTGKCLFTGINEMFQFNKVIEIYPNPSNGLFNIISSENISNIELIDELGIVVFRKKIPGMTKSFIVNEKLSPEIYFIKIQSKNNFITKKIFITY